MYDPTLSYEENYMAGPFPEWCLPDRRFPVLRFTGTPRFSLLGNPLHLPLGIPAGPLLNSRFIAVAWSAGVSVCTYKTVRSRSHESHPHPNVLSIAVQNQTTELHSSVPPQKVTATHLSPEDLVTEEFRSHLSISNSFGVPSREASQWTSDVSDTCSFLKELVDPKMNPAPRAGYGFVLSFQGTRYKNDESTVNIAHSFLEDAIETQSLAEQALVRYLPKEMVPILEVNLSCPNEGGTPIYKDVNASLKLLEALKKNRNPAVKLIAKIGPLSDEETLEFVSGSKGLVDAISSINTVSARILSAHNQSILGSGDEIGGVCGNLIFQENIAMLKKLRHARDKAGLSPDSLALISVGGINSAARVFEALESGADHVQAATACMWNLDLPFTLAGKLDVPYRKITP